MDNTILFCKKHTRCIIKILDGKSLVANVDIEYHYIMDMIGGYIFFKKKVAKTVTMVEIGELVFFKGIECLRKSKLKNEFLNQEKVLKK